MYRRNQARVIVPFLTPALVLYLLFVIYPDVQAFWLSLHRWRGLSKKTYIGLGNYDKMLHDSVFWMALRHNVFFVIVTLVGVTVLALLIAVVLTSRVHGAGFFRTVYFFPSTISIVAIAAIWKLIYNPIWGPPAVAYTKLGRRAPFWLGDEHLVLWSLAIVLIWGAVGFHMTLYIAGIRNIPPTFFEAAAIDGANSWQKFRFITVPLLWEVIRISLAFLIIGGLNIFATIRIMMVSEGLGGVPDSAQVLATYLYEQAFSLSFYGYGTAIAIVLFVLTMIVTLIFLGITRRRQIIEY